MSALGILGLLIGCFLLTDPRISCQNNASIFHEVVYEPGPSINSLFGKVIDSLERTIRKRKDKNKAIALLLNPKRRPAVSEKHRDSLIALSDGLQRISHADTNQIRVLRSYLTYCPQSSLRDSVRYGKLLAPHHFLINADSLAGWEKRYGKGETSFAAPFLFRDTAMSFPISGIDTFRIVNAENNVRFLAKHPAAGVWVLSILIFCSFCCVAIFTCISLHQRIHELFVAEDMDHNTYMYYVVFAITLFVLWLMKVVWSHTFYDEEVIKDLYFLKDWHISIRYLITLGYVCGAFCLAGFIRAASVLSFLAKNIKESTRPTQDDKKIAGNADREELAESEKKDNADVSPSKNDKEIYDRLAGFFNSYFLLSGVILTLMVLCTGGLYTTVNSLYFVKLLTAEWGYSPARPDFIVLYGGIHTILLLLIYIPAKLRFNEICFTPDASPIVPGTEKTSWKEFFTAPLSQVKDLLIAISPLMAGLLQAVFNMFVK